VEFNLIKKEKNQLLLNIRKEFLSTIQNYGFFYKRGINSINNWKKAVILLKCLAQSSPSLSLFHHITQMFDQAPLSLSLSLSPTTEVFGSAPKMMEEHTVHSTQPQEEYPFTVLLFGT
jgi:hypothetical protein